MDIWVVFVDSHEYYDDDMDTAWHEPVAYFSTKEKAKEYCKTYPCTHDGGVDGYFIELHKMDLIPEIEDMWWLDDKEEN